MANNLTTCIRKAGKALDKKDAEQIKSLRDDLKADGLKPDDAAIKATIMHMTDLKTERKVLVEAVADPYGLNYEPLINYNSVSSSMDGMAPEHSASAVEARPLEPGRKYPQATGETAGAIFPKDGIVPMISGEDFKAMVSVMDWVFPQVNKKKEQVSYATKARLGQAQLWTKDEKKPDDVKEGYYKGPGNGVYIEQEEADAKFEEWQDYATSQRENPKGFEHYPGRGDNRNKTVISLFDKTGNWAQPYVEAGYEVITFDIQNGQDIADFSTEYFTENFDINDVFLILAACPCTDFASSGSKHFDAKDADGRTEASKDLVFKTLQTIEYFRPQLWALENPVGRLQSTTGLPDWRMGFHPHNFGEDYTKKTLLWGNFNPEVETANVIPYAGSKSFTESGSKSIATKNKRSATPLTFAYSFFKSNNALDMSSEQYLTTKYTNIAPTIREALSRGMTEAQVDAVVSEYWDFDGGEAQSALLDAMEGDIPDAVSLESFAETGDIDPKVIEDATEGYRQGHAYDLSDADMDSYRAGLRGEPQPVPATADIAFELGMMYEDGLMHRAELLGEEAAPVEDEQTDEEYQAELKAEREKEDAELEEREAAREEAAEWASFQSEEGVYGAFETERETKILAAAAGKRFAEDREETRAMIAKREADKKAWREARYEGELGDVRKMIDPWITALNTFAFTYRLPTTASKRSDRDSIRKGATPILKSMGVKVGGNPDEQLDRLKALKLGVNMALEKARHGMFVTKYTDEALLGAAEQLHKGRGKAKLVENDATQNREAILATIYKAIPDYSFEAYAAGESGEWTEEAAAEPVKKPLKTKKKRKDYGKKNKVFTESAADKARALIKSKLGTLNSGIDPELMSAGVTMAGYHIEAGARKFIDFADAMIEDLGAEITPYLRSFYESVRYYPGADATGMDDATTADQAYTDLKARIDAVTERLNAEREPRDTEQDSENGQDDAPAADADIQNDGRGGSGSGAVQAGEGTSGTGEESAAPVDLFGAPVAGERSDNVGGTKGSRPANAATGGADSIRSRPDSTGGSYAERDPGPEVEESTSQAPAVIPDAKFLDQAPKAGDLAQIKAQMPFLTEGQAVDVAFAEKRFSKPEGTGVLFTNGTGTGKTFSGLGYVKRLVLQGKKNILIAAPKQTIAAAWIDAGKDFFGLEINKLENTRDPGKGIVVTTFANLGDNPTLMSRDWDATVMDEAHYLASSAEGKTTKPLKMLRALTMKRGTERDRVEANNHELVAERNEAWASAKNARKSDDERHWQAADGLQKKGDDIARRIDDMVLAEQERVKGIPMVERPRTVFLSATPFAYEKTVKWANEFLFDWGVDDPGESQGYNQADSYESFMMTHFGYRIRYNKLTEPDAKVDTGLMQRAFNTWLKKEGALSGRALDSEYDYDRRFVMTPSSLGRRVDEALDWLRDTEGDADDMKLGKSQLSELLKDSFDYHSRMYFLEAMKAREAIPAIHAHLEHGRKVVVMHDFKKGGTLNPFIMRPQNDEAKLANAEFLRLFNDLIHSFEALPSPIETLSEEFPGALVYNGNVSAKKRVIQQNEFNSNDKDSPKLIIAQGDAMREGVSIHDTTGTYQRVMIHLGMPVKPTAAIQQEGRIFRTGQGSDAIFRYFTIGTNWERAAFASKIAKRAGAAENLAMGEQARGLKDAFIQAYEDASEYPPGFEGEGKGGKEADAALAGALTPWDMAKSYYFGTKQQGKGRGARGREHSEFFATPEPLGLKMVAWADMRGGEQALEPSAGHGAIGRFFPENTTNRAIEFTNELSSKLALHFDGDVQTGDFLEHNVVNKYDAIVMNPPFGAGGADAVKHVAKAMKHIRNGGRIVALIPEGPAADKRFEKLFESEEAASIYIAATIKLPKVTFERAGTAVQAKVVVLEKQTNEKAAAQMAATYAARDYSNADTIEAFFDRLETSEIPPRTPTGEEQSVKAPTAKTDKKRANGDMGLTTMDSKHSKTKAPLFVVNMSGDMGDKYSEINAVAKENGGFYIRAKMRNWYKPPAGETMQGKPTFTFNSAGDRAAFLADLEIFGLNEPGKPEGAARAAKPGYLSVDQVQKIADRLTSGKTKLANITVLQSMDEMPPERVSELRRQGLTSISGYYHRPTGEIYLIADGLTSARSVQVTIMHEAIGHRGIERMMGDDFDGFLQLVDSAKESDPVIADMYAAVKEAYPDASPAVMAAEVIAFTSESLPSNSWVRKAIKWMRAALRKMGFTVPFTNRDIIDALHRAKDQVRAGDFAGAGGQGVAFQAAYHGSPHRHSGFKTAHIGTGEGNAAYGWGLYFAQQKGTAEYYRDMTGGEEGFRKITVDGKHLTSYSPLQTGDFSEAMMLIEEAGSPEKALAELDERVKGLMYPESWDYVRTKIEEYVGKEVKFDGMSPTLYEVQIPEKEDMLDYDAPMIEQHEIYRKLKPAVDHLKTFNINGTGGEFYDKLARNLGSQEAASKYIKSLGVPGLRYFDDNSRYQAPDVPSFDSWAGYFKGADLEGASDTYLRELRSEYNAFVEAEDTRTHNFVVFDDAQVEITETLFRREDQPDMFEAPAAEAGKLTAEEVEEWRRVNKVSQRQGRVPEVQEAAKKLKAGEIKGEEYRDIVKRFMPIMPIVDVPALTTVEEMSGALATNKAKNILGVDREIKEGTRIASRLDIPAYDFYNTWVVTLHDGSIKGGKSVAYGAAAVMDNVEFVTNPKAALGIATGDTAKAPFARIHGDWNDVSPQAAAGLAAEAMESNEWVQVGMNPFRHSYFYNKLNGEPILQAKKVVQVGPLVMAKDPVYGDHEDFTVKGTDIAFRSHSGFGGTPNGEKVWDWLVRKWQDKMRPLLLAQRDIEEAGGDIQFGTTNTYRAEEAFYGKTENDLDKMKKKYIEPLVAAMVKYKLTQQEVDDFVTARHARERNAHIRSLDGGMQDGGSGMTDQVSRQTLAAFRATGKEAGLMEVAEHVYALLQYQRDLKRSLQGDSLTDTWERKYKYYVPLKGLATNEDQDVRPMTGRGFDIRGKESKRAMGRKSRSESPIMHAIKDTTDAVIRYRKNEVGNVFLAMVRANPDPEYWQIFTDANPDKERRIISTKAGDRIVTQPVNMHARKDEYFATKKGETTYYIKLADKRLIHAMQNMGPEPLNVILRGMNTVTRFLSSMSTSYNPEFMVSNAARDIQTAVLNLLAEQDLPGGKAEGVSIAGKMVKSTPRAIRAIHASLYGKALTGENLRWQEMFEDFKADGAKTGWFDQKDVDGQAKDLNKMILKAKGGAAGTGLKTIQLIKDVVEHSNTAVENGVRLSVYVHAREAGISRQKAASLAKNLTVNFNRKGEIGGALNSVYMFANASVQGTANFGRTMASFKDDPVTGKRSLNRAQKAGAALVGTAFALAMLNRYMSDEDDDGVNWYDKVPQHVRERNIVLMKSMFGGPEQEYYTIPLPYGYNVFYNLGDTAEAAINSKYRTKAQLATGLMTAIAGSFSPIGFEGSDRTEVAALKSISPTVLSPIVQLSVNENFYGAPIYRENGPYDVPAPDSSLHKRSTKAWTAKVSKFFNEATGGSEYRSGLVDFSPDTLGHLFDFGTGSAGAFYSRAFSTGQKAAAGKELEDREIPFYRKVSGKVMPYEDQSRFYARRDELAQISKEFKALPSEARDDYRAKYNTELKLSYPMKAAEKKLANLRKLRKAAESSKSLSEEARQERLDKIQTKMDATIDDFNRRYSESM